MNKPFFVSTAIDYVNAPPHVGHALEKVLADTMARFHRSQKREVFFLTGTDENALKNVQAAEKSGKTTKDFVAENSEQFRGLGKLLNLSFDAFIQTTEGRHFRGAQKMWQAFKPEDVYKKKYQGLYCVGCEEFKMEKDLADGQCSEHHTVPEMVEEENYFFRLSGYVDELKQLIHSGKIKISPEFRKNEVLSFIEMGLADLSISRSKERAKNWGVPVPDDDSQIMYVWVDALSNYITALNYAGDGELYQKFWLGDSDRVHIIGKGILRFHAIYWPAMLLSAGIPLPTEVATHEYLTINGEKMSKTLGNVIAPQKLVEKFGTDGTRYLLLTSLPYGKDGDISWERLKEKYNADLANGLGNLVSRVLKLSEKLEIGNWKLEILEFPDEIGKLLAEYHLAEALQYIWRRIAEANKYIDETKPWVLVKSDRNEFGRVIQKLLTDLACIGSLIEPFMPETAEKIEKALKEGKTEPLFQRIK